MDTLKKFEEDPAFKTAYSAFEELVGVPPESDGTDEALLKARWHNQVLEQAKRVLDLEGVPCEEFPLSGPGGHLKGLRILPGKGIYPINSLAAEVGEKLGVSLVYSPRELWGEPGHKTTARFNHEENTVFLPHGFIGTCAIHESVHHEILHAVLYHIFWKGLDSVFHGELRAATKDEPMWNSRFYERRMSFQELAAYPLSDRLLAIDLLNTLVGFDPSSFFTATSEKWKHFESKVRILNDISGETVGALDRFGAALKGESGEKIDLQYEIETLKANGKWLKEDLIIRWANLKLDVIELRIPLMDPKHAGMVSRLLELKSSGAGGDEEDALRAQLLPVIEEKTSQRRDVAAQLQSETASYLAKLTALTDKMRAGIATEKEIRDLLDETKVARRITIDLIPRESHLTAHHQ